MTQRIVSWALAFLFGCVLMLWLRSALLPQPLRSPESRLGPTSAFVMASYKPLPVYPARSLAGNIGGVAVVELHVDSAGEPGDVRVWEAPDSAISVAVRDALRSWRFRPVNGNSIGEGKAFKTTQLFYFNSKTGLVRNLADNSDGSSPGRTKGTTHEVSLSQRDRLVEQGATVLDIRDRAQYRKDRTQALNIPLEEVSARSRTLFDGLPVDYKQRRTVVLKCDTIPMQKCRFVAEQLSYMFPAAEIFSVVEPN
jgi:TonB family protein